MKKPKKLGVIFFLSSLLIIGLIIFVFLMSSYWEYQRFLRNEMAHNLSQTEIKAEMAKQWITERYEQFNVLSNIFSLAETSAEKRKLLKEWEGTNQPIYKKLYYVDANYNTIDSKGRGKVSQNEFKKIFDQAAQSENSLLTRAEFYSESKEPVFSMISAIRDESKVLKGILVGVVSLGTLEARLMDESVNQQAPDRESTWVLDSKKQVLIHSSQNMVFDFKINQENSSTYRNIERVNSLMETNNSGTIRYTVKNKENVFLSFVKTQISDGWVFMVGRLETNYLDFLLDNWMTKALLLCFSIAVVISWMEYLCLKALNPFMAMKNALISFNNGNRYFNVETKHSLESEELHQQLKIVTDKVVDQSYNVEKLIRERTKALSDLNTTMASRNKELYAINAALSENNSHLQHKATTDMLTQLLNRQEFINYTDALITDTKSGKEDAFSVLFLDLDNFKQYNDNFSHEIGDFVLRSISDLIQNNVRVADVTARYGGDEFVILIKHPELSVAVATAERILSKIMEINGFSAEISEILERPVFIQEKDQLSCSIGVVHYTNELGIEDAEDLLALADDMMYQAKKSGKARIEIYEY